ncbi:MAG: hypothetical protein RIC80_00395 [Cyclobacteriaceae bacterium]
MDKGDEVFSVFESARLVTDKLNETIQSGDTLLIETTQGFIGVSFVIDGGCAQDECGICDTNLQVDFHLHSTDSSKILDRIYMVRCDKEAPIIYNIYECPRSDMVNIQLAESGEMIFSIREITPYPSTREEIIQAILNNQYQLNLNIKNRCL